MDKPQFIIKRSLPTKNIKQPLTPRLSILNDSDSSKHDIGKHRSCLRLGLPFQVVPYKQGDLLEVIVLPGYIVI